MKKIIVFIIMFLTGCAMNTPIPQPAPMPCEVRVKGECRDQSASERGGAVVRGHGEETKEIQP